MKASQLGCGWSDSFDSSIAWFSCSLRSSIGYSASIGSSFISSFYSVTSSFWSLISYVWESTFSTSSSSSSSSCFSYSSGMSIYSSFLGDSSGVSPILLLERFLLNRLINFVRMLGFLCCSYSVEGSVMVFLMPFSYMSPGSLKASSMNCIFSLLSYS